jgi:hypothetical protein
MISEAAQNHWCQLCNREWIGLSRPLDARLQQNLKALSSMIAAAASI